MFRKIVTELSYSPALAGRLGEYIRQIRQEKIRREISLVLLVLVLIIQLFATSFPPESANASNPIALTDTPLQSMNNYLTTYYDQNVAGTRDFLNSIDVTRPELLAATLSTVTPSPNLLLWSTKSHGDGTEKIYTFSTKDGLAQQTNYYSPLQTTGVDSRDNPKQPLVAYVGQSATIGWFALLKDSGNLVTRPLKQTTCSDETIASSVVPAIHQACLTSLHSSLSAYDITNGKNIPEGIASPSDRIMYTLSVKNTASTTLSTPLRIELGDVLEYAKILDMGGGTFDIDTKTLTWGSPDIQADGTLSRSFIVQLLPVIPSMAQGVYNTSSYDCAISTSFGNRLSAPVSCPFPKAVEQTIHTLPIIPPVIGIIILGTTICIAAYFYLRSRQFLAELHHIQHNHSGSL